MTAGYSNRSLADKLGIKPGTRILILNPPEDYASTLGPLPAVTLLRKTAKDIDFIQAFFRERERLAKNFIILRSALAQTGSLWISWPKKASGVETDLNEGIVRDLGLSNGLVDVKVCAVDDVWSGLKFMYRLKDRTG